MPDPDYEALCKELIYELARAANGLSNRTANDNHRALWAKDAYQAADRAKAVFARWGRPAIELVPVASEVRASVVELQVGVEFLDNEGLVVIANYLRRAIALLERLSTSTNQEESK